MAKNHPLMKDVKNWILDSFSFMDGIGYDIQFADDIFGMENTKAFSIDIDGLTDYDFEKGKENLIKSVPKKIKAEFPYLRISSARDGNYFVMFITLLDNNDYLEDTKLTYINLNESKKSACKSMKEKLNDSGDVRFNDIYSCDLVNVLTVTVYDKELYEKLREEDLVLYQKGVYEQIDWKSFQDEIGYLKDDIYASDDFDVKFTLSNGVLIIDVLDNTDKDVIMEYRLESKIVN